MVLFLLLGALEPSASRSWAVAGNLVCTAHSWRLSAPNFQFSTLVTVGHRTFVVHVHVGVVLFDFIFHSIDVVVVVLVHDRPFSGRRTAQGRGISK